MTGPTLNLRRFANRAEIDAALMEKLERAFAGPSGGEATAVMLSGGSTPIPVYRSIAGRSVRAASNLHVLFSDERYVPSHSHASNFHQTRSLIEALRLPEDQVLRVRTELLLAEAADDYNQRLDQLVAKGITIGLGLLGLGADGHTASLFSPEHIEHSQGRWAVAVNRPDGMNAVSVTPRLISLIQEPVFVVAGADKKDALAGLLAADPKVIAYQAIAGCRHVEIWTT